MAPRKIRRAFAVGTAGLAVLLSGCNISPSAPAPTPETESEREKPRLGLMTSLPLYWPLNADLADIASGAAAPPWQRRLLERDYELVPLDTLSPIQGLSEEAGDTDPLSGLDLIAVIQPRGLSAADNAALDGWVRGGGRLLIALDPLLTGEYDIALGDPRRPNDTALIPPVIPRWGIANTYAENLTEVRYAELPGGRVPVWMGSNLSLAEGADNANLCRVHDSGLILRCDSVGKGTVTYIGDATLFEHRDLIGADGEAIAALLAYAFAN
ncbi:hypothetical protein [Qipengyuania sp. ASV99]|uniref:hypothetical protein n=1 Tax=Qipengyuania sp. ASV99 TaxID=3399681 RepID=UPI003A4C54B1